MTMTTADLLTDEMLARFDERAPVYDRENRFFDEDWEELVDSGYLLATVPTEFGGRGLGLDEYTKLVRRLAYVAPATALATNMHCYWTGVAADLLEAGDDSCRFILEHAAQGEVFHALHGEAGNDIPVLLAVATAEPADGGWEVSGHKIFGSLTPVWTYGGFHAMDTSTPDAPADRARVRPPRHAGHPDHRDVGHARHASHAEPGHGDGQGARARRAGRPRVPARLRRRGLVPGRRSSRGRCMGFSAVYLGAAKRAFDITIESMPRRTSIALTNSMAHHPEVQHNVAEMRIAYDAAEALLDRTAADWANGVEHADWPVRLVATRHFVINAAYDIVDRALDLSGGAGAFKRNRLEQLFRDVRMGRFHPGNTLLAHELVGKLCLGINPDDPQRWG